MRLFCDEMLVSVGRWLRAAGYDTAIARSGMPDADILDLCAREVRTLVSGDRRLVGTACEQVSALLLPQGSVDDHALLLARALDVDWTHAPFTRCLVDNSPLRCAESAERAIAPPPFDNPSADIRACPACGRIYWQGGHVRRMRERLERWKTSL